MSRRGAPGRDAQSARRAVSARRVGRRGGRCGARGDARPRVGARAAGRASPARSSRSSPRSSSRAPPARAAIRASCSWPASSSARSPTRRSWSCSRTPQPNTVRNALWWMMGSVGDATLDADRRARSVYVVRRWRRARSRWVARSTCSRSARRPRPARRRRRCARCGASFFVCVAARRGDSRGRGPRRIRRARRSAHRARGSALRTHRRCSSASALVGAALVVGADLLGRTLRPPAELPLGAVTALVGVPFFLVKLRRLT